MIRRRRNCIAAFILSIILSLCLFCSGLGEEISFDLPADELILSETPESSFGSEPEGPETTEWETVYSDPMDRSLFPDVTYDYDLPETEPEETATEPVRPGTLQSQEIIDAQNRAMENLQEEPA